MKEELRMQTHQYGAHEVMELHEVMNGAMDGINTLHLYISHAKDPELRRILANQLHFMTDDYNRMVHLINGRGAGAAVPYRSRTTIMPQAGEMAAPVMTNAQTLHIDDRDVASAILGCHKASAKQRIAAALECADPEIRGALIQGAANCANQAYELWSYMHHRGYYTLASLQEAANAQLLRGYQPIPAEQVPSMMAGEMPKTSHQTVGPFSQSGLLSTQSQFQQGQTNASQIFSSPSYLEQTGAGTPQHQQSTAEEIVPSLGSTVEQQHTPRSPVRKKSGGS
jgi:spore coat protein CotF